MTIKNGGVGEIEGAEAREVQLDPVEREALVTQKVTCPFLGSAITEQELPVRNAPGNPLASIQNVIELGNRGGGDLGVVLGFFAKGNHGMMRSGLAQRLDTLVPSGLFSLELPGSQGSHPGHSGILQGDPTQLDSGRFSPADLTRLETRSRNGLIKRSDIARFIAENFLSDPNRKSFPIFKWAKEVLGLAKAMIRVNRTNRSAEISRLRASILGGNHLLASAGEFGLLLAFLHNSPRTQHDRDPAFSMSEIKGMFEGKSLPKGWGGWKKTRRDWLLHTLKLAVSATAYLIKIRINRSCPEHILRAPNKTGPTGRKTPAQG